MRPRTTKLCGAVALALALGAAAAAALPWRVPRGAVAVALAGGLAPDIGLRAAVAGPVTFKLLPRPRLQAARLSAAADDGAVTLDAPALKADLDIPSLLRGRWRITAATLVEPTVTVDLDRLAARTRGAAAADDGPGFQLRLRSGLLRTRSTSGLADSLATDVDATASWSGAGDRLVVSGSAAWRGTTAQFAGSLLHPSRSLTPDGSAASLTVDSPLFSLSAEGLVSGGTAPQFTGRAALTTPSLPRLARVLGSGPLAIAAERAQVGGDAVARPHDVSLSNAVIRLDRSRFEGTLAWRREGARGLVAGTLATDLLDLDALLGPRPDAPELGRLFHEPVAAPPFGTDLDLRVSAAKAVAGPVALDDAALGALARGDRLELTLDEARAFGGTVKARAVATLDGGGIDAHAELSAKRVDLGRVSDGLGARGRAAGSLTARVAVDGRGRSLDAVVADLAGEGRIEIDGGRLAGLSLAQALRGLGRRVPLEVDRRATPTTFDRAQWDVAVRGGVVRIPDGRLTAPGIAVAFGAETGLPDGRVDVHAVAAEADGSGVPVRGGLSLPFDVVGSIPGPLTVTKGSDRAPAGPASAAGRR